MEVSIPTIHVSHMGFSLAVSFHTIPYLYRMFIKCQRYLFWEWLSWQPLSFLSTFARGYNFKEIVDTCSSPKYNMTYAQIYIRVYVHPGRDMLLKLRQRINRWLSAWVGGESELLVWHILSTYSSLLAFNLREVSCNTISYFSKGIRFKWHVGAYYIDEAESNSCKRWCDTEFWRRLEYFTWFWHKWKSVKVDTGMRPSIIIYVWVLIYRITHLPISVEGNLLF